MTETTVNQAGVATAVKHYATGRWARELIKMMPDAKNYYSGDDSKSTILFMGVADVANDLSAVTLYASRFIQTSPKSTLANKAPGEAGAVVGAELGAGTLEWIRLGHATDAGIKALIDAGTKSTDIFDIALETAAGVLPVAVPGVVGTGIAGAVTAADMVNAGYKRVFDYYHRHTKGKAEWLRLRPGMNQAAAFLETRRYAVYLGATSEWTKMEGVAMNAANKKAYIAISYQYDSMTDGVGDIQMGLLTAGNTYELSLAANVIDRSGIAINSAWAFNIDTRKLSRILSIPMGAEATGLMAVDNMNGFAYIGSSYQHPGDKGVGKPPVAMVAAVEAANPTFAEERNRSGGIGYLHIKGMPRM